jgi:hypothetical protein
VILLIVAMLVIAACVAVSIYVTRQRARRIARERELPPLIFSMRSSPAETGLIGTPETSPVQAFQAGRIETPQPTRPVASFAPPVDAPVTSFAPPVDAPVTSFAPTVDAPVTRTVVPTSDTVHFRRPTEEALQLLPGRLEVLSGLTMPREIRFVRVPGERPQLILGREPGGSPQDVALPSSTVSRKHARLDFSSGRWGVTNLSRTNPVVVNDETLSSTDGPRLLADGDRIELGDVVLRFCAH